MLIIFIVVIGMNRSCSCVF